MRRRHDPVTAQSRPRAAGTKAQAAAQVASPTARDRHGRMSYMTCNEFQLVVEIAARSDSPAASEEFSEHIRECKDCRHFLETQQEVGHHLRLVRDSAPDVPVSLDSRILGNYHYQLAAATVRQSQPRPRMIPWILSWKSGVALAALVILTWVLATRKSVQSTVPRESPAAAVSPPAVPLTASNTETKSAPVIAKPRAKRLRTMQQKPSATPAVAAENALPAGFRGLMFCDALSCPQTMEMIRVELPPGFASFAPASSVTNGAVLADVLVGP